MSHPGVVIGAKVGQAIGIVEAEGNLAAVIHAVHRHILGKRLGVEIGFGQDGGDICLLECNAVGVLRLDGEDLVLIAEASVDDGHAHALTLIAQVPGGVGAHGGAHIFHIGQKICAAGYRSGFQLRDGKAGHQEGLFDARQLVQLCQIPILHRGRDGVGQKTELSGHMDVIAQGFADALDLSLLTADDGLHGRLLLRPQSLAQMDLHGVYGSDGGVFKGDHDPNIGVLSVGSGVQADGLATLQVGLTQNLPHGGGISGGLLGVEVPGFQDGSILCGDVALLTILQIGQCFGFAFCQSTFCDVHIIGSKARINHSLFPFQYVCVSCGDEGGLSGLAVYALLWSTFGLGSAWHVSRLDSGKAAGAHEQRRAEQP